MPGLVLLILVIVLVLWAVVSYNRLIGIRNQVLNGWRQIDVQLKRRHDLIPNLVNTVRGAMEFERDTLTQVMEARARAGSAVGPRDAAQHAAADLPGQPHRRQLRLHASGTLRDREPGRAAGAGGGPVHAKVNVLEQQASNRRRTWLVLGLFVALFFAFGYGFAPLDPGARRAPRPPR